MHAPSFFGSRQVAAVVGLTVVLAVVASVPVSAQPDFSCGITDTTEHTGPRAALDAKKTALDLRHELHRLNQSHDTVVDDGALRSVDLWIDDGNTSFNRGAYTEAETKYRKALEVACIVLVRGYKDAAGIHVTTADQLVNQTDEDTTNLTKLSIRIDRIRSRLTTVTTLDGARDLHDNAADLEKAVRKERARIEESDTSPSLPLVGAATVIGVIIGGLLVGLVVRQRSEPEPNPDDSQQEDEIQVRKYHDTQQVQNDDRQ